MTFADYVSLVLIALIAYLFFNVRKGIREAHQNGSRIDAGSTPYILLALETISALFNAALGYNIGSMFFGVVAGFIAAIGFAALNFSYRPLTKLVSGCIQHKQSLFYLGLGLFGIVGTFFVSQIAFSTHMNAMLVNADDKVIAADTGIKAETADIESKLKYAQIKLSEYLIAEDENKIAEYEYHIAQYNAALLQAKADHLNNRPAEYHWQAFGNKLDNADVALVFSFAVELIIIGLCFYLNIFVEPVIKIGGITLLDKIVDWNHRKVYQNLLTGWFEYSKDSPQGTNQPVIRDVNPPPKNQTKPSQNSIQTQPSRRNRPESPRDHRNGGGGDLEGQPKTPTNKPSEDSQKGRGISQMRKRFDAAGSVPVGGTFECACCGVEAVKNIYSQRFCSTDCRKKYHNYFHDHPETGQDKKENAKPETKNTSEEMKKGSDKKQPAQKETNNKGKFSDWTHYQFNSDGSLIAFTGDYQHHFKISELGDKQIQTYKRLHTASQGEKVTVEQSKELLRGVAA